MFNNPKTNTMATFATTTKIKKSFTHDRMSLKGILESGANVQLSVSRSGERLVCALNNDPTISKIQIKAMSNWIAFRNNESNKDRFDRLEKLLLSSNNSESLISNLNKI